MPTYYRHEKTGFAWCCAVGNYTFEETLNNYRNALADPQSAGGVHLLMDVRQSDETRTQEEMHQIAELFSRSENFAGRCAVLVDPNAPVRYGLGRMLAALADYRGLDFRVFVEEKAAVDWLMGPGE